LILCREKYQVASRYKVLFVHRGKSDLQSYPHSVPLVGPGCPRLTLEQDCLDFFSLFLILIVRIKLQGQGLQCLSIQSSLLALDYAAADTPIPSLSTRSVVLSLVHPSRRPQPTCPFSRWRSRCPPPTRPCSSPSVLQAGEHPLA
jgi:hypothetical protein